MHALVLQDIKQRLPLWKVEVVSVEGTSLIRAELVGQDDCSSRLKCFVPVMASSKDMVDKEWISRTLRLLRSFHPSHDGFVATEVLDFLCFFDTSGTISYYQCEGLVDPPTG